MVWSGMGFLDLGVFFSFCISVSLFSLIFYLLPTLSEADIAC